MVENTTKNECTINNGCTYYDPNYCPGYCMNEKEKTTEKMIYYWDKNEKIIKKPASILKDYKGKPMPKVDKLTIRFTATSLEYAKKICENKYNLLIDATDKLNVSLACEFPHFIGICLAEPELFLWIKANTNKENPYFIAKMVGEMYTKELTGGFTEGRIEIELEAP